MYLQQFDFTLKYCRGKDNIADYLSRHSIPLDEKERRTRESYEDSIKHIGYNAVPKAISFEEVRRETESDHVLPELIKIIETGQSWRLKKNEKLSAYYKIFSELSELQGVVMRGTQIVMPTKLQQRVIDICHEGHLGIVKSKQLLRSKVWFPNIDKMMEVRCRNCLPCQAAVVKKQRNPLEMTPTPSEPWESIAIDFCGPFPTGEMILVAIDERSRYPAVEIINSTSARTTICALEKIFAIYGIPSTLKSDNGPPFKSKEFASFCENQGIKHRRITPRWPESNGLVENFMKNVGKSTKIAHCEGKDWKRQLYVFLGNYRATPHPNTGLSPNEALTGRNVRGKLPDSAKEPTSEIDVVRRKDEKVKQKQKQYADEKRRTEYHKIEEGDAVLARQEKKTKLTTPYDHKPYQVESVKGSMITAKREGKSLTRNSSVFKKILTNPEMIQNDEDTLEEIEMEENTIQEEEPEEIKTDTETPILTPPEEPQLYTRSGRPVNKPQWMNDYVS